MTIPVTVALAAFCGILMVALATRVSMQRMRFKIAFGDGGNPALMRSIRVHANTAEHAPLFLLMVLAYELSRGADALLVSLAAAFAVARLAFTAGLLGRNLHQARMLGALLTYLAQAVIAAALALAALRLA
jgi:uncharacterized protein